MWRFGTYTLVIDASGESRMGKGVLDVQLRMTDLLRPDVDYERPRGGGKALFDLVGDLGGRKILDLGCGLGPHREALAKRGAIWIGLDLTGRACTVIADSGRLPFCDGSFDGVLCSAVLEHLPEPGISLEEMRRVLLPGGRLFGYVAFLEPFHGMSYFHMSHMGLEYLLFRYGFRPERIYPSHVGIAFQLEQVLFPKPVPVLQTLTRGVLRWSARVLLALNQWSREILTLLRRLPAEERREQRRQYRQLLSLRYAVGLNFIAIRSDARDGAGAGYRTLVKTG
jgi:SAM-dependent methyltransferase